MFLGNKITCDKGNEAEGMSYKIRRSYDSVRNPLSMMKARGHDDILWEPLR